MNGFYDGFVFFFASAINLIVFVNPLNRFVGRNFNDAQAVDFGKFFRLGRRSASHAAKLIIEAEIVLESNASESHVLGLDRASFFRFDRLMKTVRQAATRHHTTGEFVDQHHLIVTHDVVFVLGEQLVRFKRVVHMVDDGCAFGIVKRLFFRKDLSAAQNFFQRIVAFVSERHTTSFFVNRVVLVSQLRDQLVDGNVKL